MTETKYWLTKRESDFLARYIIKSKDLSEVLGEVVVKKSGNNKLNYYFKREDLDDMKFIEQTGTYIDVKEQVDRISRKAVNA